MLRAIDLRGAVAINVIAMVGIGPLITLPLVVSALHGHAIVAWVLGAILAACDGLVYAELGSLYPSEGGTYVYLREAFGPHGPGRFFSFLFTWQYVLSMPLVLASGYIGIASYAVYLAPALGASPLAQSLLACGVGLFTIVLLYRAIPTVTRIAVALGVVAVGALLVVAAAGAVQPTAAPAPATPFAYGALGGALVITLYDYLGYGDICSLGSEVRRAEWTIPVSILISVGLVAGLYIALQVAILHALPWPDAARAPYVGALAVEHAWGVRAAAAATVLILITAFASTYAGLLGASRIPYAAAIDGLFFSAFARLHPRAKFPHVSLLAIGLLALPACFLSLDRVIGALVAGLVFAQSLAQIAALALVRARGTAAPFRMWLYPLPALAALAGWLYVLYGSGAFALGYGLLTVLAGAGVYLVRARLRVEWPFVARVAAVLLACGIAGLAPQAQAATSAFDAAAIVQRDGYPVFTVHGKPFFVYGASFFYERLPRTQWRRALLAYKALGINTIDLYVIWNWHEIADGRFDFDGRTNPRRDLLDVMRLIRELGFYAVVRPGPVIRNEWRNGGYPAWLLARPEYRMPQHDLLEGRYPPIATLQNAHSDDAAAAWLANTTHLRYARRWLQRVLREVAPYRDRIIAVQLDDDQGAYLDNQTWPAPHLQAYLERLASIVRAVTGPAIPLFINTYEMKVTASSPVWAMGDWYQSDALVIGEHDRASLEFATGLLQTQLHRPLMLSEFQAGWLAPPDDVRARQTDPSNTTLALHTLLGMGVRGVVNFPVQDTLYPSGMEVPFANAFYAWEAALGLDLRPSRRYAPTRAFGELVRAYGPLLAQTHRVADAAIAYTPSALTKTRALTNDDFFAVAARTEAAQRFCRAHGLGCDLVDLGYADAATLARYRTLLIPMLPGRPLRAAVNAELGRYALGGGRIVRYASDDPPASALRAIGGPAVSGVDGALERGGGATFLDAINYAGHPVVVRGASIAEGAHRLRLPAFTIPARGAVLLPIHAPHIAGALPPLPPPARGASIPVRPDAPLAASGFRAVPPHGALAYRADVYGEGRAALVLENALVRIVVAPDAGARAFVFEDKRTRRNVFTSVGAMRDDASLTPAPSTSDKLGAWTHAFPAGTFNRPYRVRILASGARAEAELSYNAPDVLPSGARFVRTIALAPDARSFEVRQSMTLQGDEPRQRAVSTSSLTVGDALHTSGWLVVSPGPHPFAPRGTFSAGPDGIGLYDPASHELATISWEPGAVERSEVSAKDFSLLVRLTLAPGAQRLRYGFTFAPDAGAAERVAGQGR